MFGWEKPVNDISSFTMGIIPYTLMYGFAIFCCGYLLVEASELELPGLVTSKTPISLTLLPGVQLSVRYRSTHTITDLGISPVGISSGASWSFMICWSKYSLLSWSSLYVLSPQDYLSGPGLVLLSQYSGAITLRNPNPTVSTFSWPQLLHFHTAVRVRIVALLVEVIIPGTQTNLVIRLLWSPRNICGFSSEWTWT